MSVNSKSISQWSRLTRLLSDSTLTKKATLNAFAVLLDYSARLMIGFIVTPLLVSGLGAHTYGVWQIISRLTSYLTAATGRPTQALKWTIANLQSADDYDEKRRNVGSAVAVWFIYLPLLLSLGTLVVWYLPVWFEIDSSVLGVARLATWILVAKMTLTSLVMIPESVLQGENSAYKRIGLSTLMVFVGGGITVLALQLNTGLVGVAVAAIITSILTGITYLWIARQNVPWLSVARPRLSELKSFMALSGWFLFWRLIMKMMMASDILLIGAFISVDVVTGYSLTKYVPETLVGLLASVVFGMSPGIGGILGSGDIERVALLRSETYLITWLAATVIGTVVLLWNQAFIALWVGPIHSMDSITNSLIVLMMIQFVLIRIESNFIDLTLNIQRKVILGLLSVCVSLAAAYLLIQYAQLGVAGLCIGFILGRLMLSIGYPAMIGKLFHLSLWDQVRAASRPGIVTLIFFMLATVIDNVSKLHGHFITDSWLRLGIGVFLTGATISALVWLLGLTKGQRSLLFNRVRRVVG